MLDIGAVLFLVALAFCLWQAGTGAARRLPKAVKTTYRHRMTARKNKTTRPPNAGRPAFRTRATTGIAAVWFGGLEWLRDFGQGWRVDWQAGRERGQEWIRRRTGQPAPPTGEHPEPVGDSTPDQPKATAESTGPAGEPVPGEQPDPAESTEALRLRVVSELDTAPTPSASDQAPPPSTPSTEGTDPMRKRSSGEITNMQDLLRILKEEIAESAIDLEGAKAEQQLAVDDAARVELMVASLQQVNAGPQDLAEVAALRDTAIVRKDAAARAASAAEQRHAAASKALAGVQRRHGALAEAHASAPHAAERSFYTPA